MKFNPFRITVLPLEIDGACVSCAHEFSPIVSHSINRVLYMNDTSVVSKCDIVKEQSFD